nr:CHAP domain-containing protein [Bifidobacterium magnum]
MSCAMGLAAVGVSFAPTAYADTYSDLVNAQNQSQASRQREAQLRAQLSDVSSSLADQIVELDNLTNTKIPAAQAKVDAANAAAADAKSEAQAASSRLQAAQRDKSELEEKIKQTGEDYDDARATVAQMARDSMHGSDTSDVMSVVTGSTSTKDFIQGMQSRAAVSRSEANAASDYANDLSTSMTRSERLSAIEKRISTLKSEADQKSAAAQEAAASAQSQAAELDALRAKGESQRASLESQQGQLKSDAARQAAQSVLLESQVDSYNRQYQQEQAEAAARVQAIQAQGTTQPSAPAAPSAPSYTPSTPSAPAAPSAPSQPAAPVTPVTPSQPSVPEVVQPTNPGAQGTHNGDYGNAYAGGQCTWWAYNRRAQMGIGTPSYLGNGGQWWATAPSYGLRVDHTPQVGAAISFLPGQAGADGTYGHVAVVESVSGDTITISEMNVKGVYVVSYRTLGNASQYYYVH